MESRFAGVAAHCGCLQPALSIGKMDLQSKTRAGRRSGEKATPGGDNRTPPARQGSAARVAAAVSPAAQPDALAAPPAVRYLTVGPEQAGQ
ncbi:MAG TPA: hypothetical protein VF229_00225, partial [Burkholderiaceae bacterium]